MKIKPTTVLVAEFLLGLKPSFDPAVQAQMLNGALLSRFGITLHTLEHILDLLFFGIDLKYWKKHDLFVLCVKGLPVKSFSKHETATALIDLMTTGRELESKEEVTRTITHVKANRNFSITLSNLN